MTLILTELSTQGIAMVADSAVTSTSGGRIIVRANVAQKLYEIPYLQAGISCWGIGMISGVRTDQWLSDFINNNSTITTLQDFANELSLQLNAQVTPNPSSSSLGFHLAGFDSYHGNTVPSFYHIHDGPSTSLQSRGITINPNQFNANHDVPPNLFRRFTLNRPYVTRNGDFQIYANIFGFIEGFFNQMQRIRLFPSPNLSDRREYLVFQIKTMAEIYRLSNLAPSIAGDINYLTINSNGIHSSGVVH